MLGMKKEALDNALSSSSKTLWTWEQFEDDEADDFWN